MDYVIRNKSGLYVKLNENGTPITCNESQKDLFEYSKANNICNSLPKALKKFNFYVECVPDIQPKVEEQKVITTNTYVPSENVTRWINEFGQCEDILDKASKRYDEAKFGKNDFLFFGRESKGLPEELLHDNYDMTIRIPMVKEARSLNLSNSVAVVVYEGMRQLGFENLLCEGHLTKF